MTDESAKALTEAMNRLAAAIERLAGPFGGIQHHGIPAQQVGNGQCLNCGGFHSYGVMCPRLQPWATTWR